MTEGGGGVELKIVGRDCDDCAFTANKGCDGACEYCDCIVTIVNERGALTPA